MNFLLKTLQINLLGTIIENSSNLNSIQMKTIYSTILLFSLLTINSIFGQHDLRLTIDSLKTDEGNICFAIYNTESSFLTYEEVYKSGSQKATKGVNSIEVKNLPKGNYAVAIFHDTNGNKNLDTNMLGIPKEKVAFSKSKMKMFGPPKFDDCSFDLNNNMEITIEMD